MLLGETGVNSFRRDAKGRPEAAEETTGVISLAIKQGLRGASSLVAFLFYFTGYHRSSNYIQR